MDKAQNGKSADELRDLYEEAAFVCIMFACRICGDVLDTDDVDPHYPVDGWIQSLSAEAIRREWLVEYTDGDFRFTCPECDVRRERRGLI